MSALREVLHATTRHPQRLLSSFVLLLIVAGLFIFTIAGRGFHHVVDNTTSTQHRSLAHAAIHDLITRPFFIQSGERGLSVNPSHSDESAFRTEAANYLHAFNVFFLTIYDQDLQPILTLSSNSRPYRIDDEKLKEAHATRSPIGEDAEFTDITSLRDGTRLSNREVIIVHTPLHDANRVIGYATVGIDSTLTHHTTHLAVEHAHQTLVLSILVAFFVLFLPMYLGVQALIQEHADLVALNTKLNELASIDTLTKIYNRRSLTEQVQLEFERLRRNSYQRTSLCVLMADIDHFKRINDSFGHQAGDVVLAEVAARIKEAVRGYDVVGRYGGEEFLIMLPNTNAEGAHTVGERIRMKVSDLPVSLADHRLVNVTISIGISVVHDPATPEDRAISVADTALYEAKEQGRNRVIITEIAPLTHALA